MARLTIELPSQASQKEFNLRRWAELLADPGAEWNRFEGRVETDRHGHIIMSPLPGAKHGKLQFKIATILDKLMPEGAGSTECPISTADGVKGADVAWASPECLAELGNRVVYPRAPEICVEVLSPSNTRSEILEKMRLYFDAGAKEVWICSGSGVMSFHGADLQTMDRSKLCPEFPKTITTR